MQKNCGSLDRGVRLLVAGLLGFFVAMQLVEGWFAILLAAFAAVLALTALLGICPFYRLIDLDTQPAVEAEDNPFAIHH